MRARSAVITVAMAIAVSNAALACGPFFPYAYFAFGRERDVLKLPEASFYQELCRVLSTYPELMWADEAAELRSRSRDADANGLIESLKAAQVPDEVATPIVESYRIARGQSPSASTNLHESLPREFALYAEGASLYHAEKFDEAIAKWKELLALPAEQRRYKSVWAAYMVGRALRDSDGVQANAAFEQARALAADGFADPLDLAVESLGWQAYLDYGAGNVVSAIKRYAAQFKLGYPASGRAYASLRMICGYAFDSPEALSACAADETARAIVTAWAVSHPHTGTAVKPWLASVLSTAQPSEIPQADALAWAAYSLGDFESARKLLDAPSAATPYGKRVRSKLLLRDGKIDQAMSLMRENLPDFPNSVLMAQYNYGDTPPGGSVDAELGVLHLGRREYIDAFDCLLRSGFWLDAAYVGDRVLTIDELKLYVDTHTNDPDLAQPLGSGYYDMNMWGEQNEAQRRQPTLADMTRYMVARRLAREDRWNEALPYYPAGQAERAKELVAAREAGKAGQPLQTQQNYWEWFVGKKPRVVADRARAKQLDTAAILTRERGILLLGTEVLPDWHVFSGELEISGNYGTPQRWVKDEVLEHSVAESAKSEILPEATTRALSASDDELRRFRESAPQPNRRFHYRAIAADLMWQSAQNLPDNDIDTMRALYKGGKYLLSLDDYLGANKFYRALVWRNPNMPYAQMADKLRWFPEGPPE